MKKKYYIILAFLSAIILFIPNNVSAQKEKLISVASVVNDDKGSPVVNAEVFSGSAYTKTDAQGRFSIAMESDAKVVVAA